MELNNEIFTWIVSHIPEGSKILELGSGDGTNLLSKFYLMFSIESNMELLNKYDSNYIFAPIDKITRWYNIEYLKDKLPKKYDLLLIDGPVLNCETSKFGMLNNLNLFNNIPNVIIINNTNKCAEFLLAKELMRLTNYDGIQIKNNKKSFIILEKGK